MCTQCRGRGVVRVDTNRSGQSVYRPCPCTRAAAPVGDRRAAAGATPRRPR